jgi:hypothetical protein
VTRKFKVGDRVTGSGRLRGVVIDPEPRFGVPGGNDAVTACDQRVGRRRIGVRFDGGDGRTSYAYEDLLSPEYDRG